MSFTDKQLLVTGASGSLGKAVVAEVRRLGARKVIAATRTPGKSQELATSGVEEREADFDRPETLQTAFRGVDRLVLKRKWNFIFQMLPDLPAELTNGKEGAYVGMVV